MSFDIFKKGLFPFVLIGLIVIFGIISIVKYANKSGQKPKVPVKSSRPKEPVRCSRPKQKEGFQVVSSTSVTKQNVASPTVRTNIFVKKPLDSYYDTYQEEEDMAKEAALNASSTVNLDEQKLPNFGAAFGNFDATIKEIPWDSDNKDYLPSDVLWGYVDPEASKSLFMKVYHQTLLSDPNNLKEHGTKPPKYQSLLMSISTDDPGTGFGLQTTDAVVGALGQQISPLSTDNLDRLRKFLNRPPASVKADIAKFTDTIGQRTKKLLGVTRAKQFVKYAATRLSGIFSKLLGKFMTKMAIRVGAMIAAAVTTLAGLVAGTVLSAGATTGALAAFSAVVTALFIAISIIDGITAVLALTIPPVLERAFDGNGICPPGSKTIREIIPNDTAYFFFTTFVPLGDLIDLFGDYICWEGADIKIKMRVEHQPYEYDRTNSLYRHNFLPDQVPDGDAFIDVVKYRDVSSNEISLCPPNLSNFTQDNRGERATYKYYENCMDGTRAATITDPICEGISTPAKAVQGIKAPCGAGLRDDGVNCIQDWRGITPGKCRIVCGNEWSWSKGGFCQWSCEASTDLGGCGCVLTTLEARMSCPVGYQKVGADASTGYDSTTGLCYAPCPTGSRREGNMCWTTKPTYMRKIYEPLTEKVKRERRNLPRLEDVKSQLGINYCDYGSPVMLDRMAQFYYDNSFANPDLLQDASGNLQDASGNILIQYDYIVKFYGVIASSELSCDVICDIKTVQYDPITGANYKETIGCSYEDDPTNTRCYRRFYFIKRLENREKNITGDPQGVFTVTGCTNSDYTAPDAMVSSWDQGVEYVPSLPKVFQSKTKVTGLKDISSMDMIKAIGKNAAIQGAGMAAGIGVGVVAGDKNVRRIAGGIIGGALASTAVTFGANELASLDAVAQPPASGDETYIVGDGSDYFLITDDEYIHVNHGPIHEQAQGYEPLAEVCRYQRTTEEFCGYKYILRDTIDRYQVQNPTKRVKQVDVLEARGRLGCYYKWREVSYNRETNEEGSDFTSKSVLQKYKIVDDLNCLMVPDVSGVSGGFLYDIVDNNTTIPSDSIQNEPNNVNNYPIRSFKIEKTDTYPSRRKITKPVRYVRIEGGQNILAFSQIIIRNTQGINVAIGKTITASPEATLSNGVVLSKNNPVDGYEMSRESPEIYQSLAGNAFFEVDLGREEFIQSVSIYNVDLPSETFPYKPTKYTNGLTFDNAVSECLNLKGVLAYKSDMERDRAAGATWDVSGWLLDVDTNGNKRYGQIKNNTVELTSITGTKDSCKISPTQQPKVNYAICYGKKPSEKDYADITQKFNRTQYSRYSNLLSRLEGYNLILKDAAQVENYRFILKGEQYQVFNNFPPLAFERKYPSKSFLVPQALPPETVLKTGCGNSGTENITCSTIGVINELVKQFNDANQNAKILKVMKAVTPSARRCDYQVQMMRISEDGNKTIGTESLRINIKEKTGTRCEFERESDGSAVPNSGTFIQVNTPDLSGNNINEGGVFSYKNILSGIQSKFTGILDSILEKKPQDILDTKSKSVNDTVSGVVGDVAVNQTLAGCPQKKCSDTDVMNAIANAYNNLNSNSNELFDFEQNRMRQIISVSGASPTECDVLFQEINETYEDILYPATETLYKVKSARFRMENKGNCVFQVATTPTAITMDISSTAFGLQSASSKLAKPYTIKEACKVDCTSPANLRAIKEKLESENATATTYTTYKTVTQSYQNINGNGKCEYLMKKDVSTKDKYTNQYETESDIETYVSATFTMNPAATCAASLESVEEFNSDDIEYKVKEDAYYFNGVKVELEELPALYGYESEKPSKLVNATTIDLTKISA